MIPERYKPEYDCYCEPGSFEAQIVEEVGAAEAKVAELEARVTELNDAIEFRDQRINEHFAEVAEQAAELCQQDEKLGEQVATIASLRNLLEAETTNTERQAATIERLTREVRELQPRVFPIACFLCKKQMDSPDDYEWHGLGNCVPLCEACDGQGFVSPARNQVQVSSPAQKLRSWNKSRKGKSKADAALSKQEPAAAKEGE